MSRTHALLTHLVLGVACMALLATHAHANLLTNGSFELGTLVNDGNHTMTLTPGATSITGWTATGRQVAWIDAANPWVLTAQDESRFLDLTGYLNGSPFGGVTQTIATTPGHQYDLTFYLGTYTQRWGGPPVSITVTAGSTNQTFTVSTTSTTSTWTPFSTVFTATGASTAVTLTGAAGFQYIGLDNAEVNPVSSDAAVPEPASYLLMALGLGVLGLTRRRRSN